MKQAIGDALTDVRGSSGQNVGKKHRKEKNKKNLECSKIKRCHATSNYACDVALTLLAFASLMGPKRRHSRGHPTTNVVPSPLLPLFPPRAHHIHPSSAQILSYMNTADTNAHVQATAGGRACQRWWRRPTRAPPSWRGGRLQPGW